jgi:5-methylcytosine-specific restriction enzyme subunit McrC
VIPIKNIYYMLSYAFEVLHKDRIEKTGAENFENNLDLYAEILKIELEALVKRGFFHEYRQRSDECARPKGKIELTESFRRLSFMKSRLTCTYDDFSIDNYLNQVLKATVKGLVARLSELNNRSEENKARRADTIRALRKLLLYFEGVSDIPLSGIDWNYRFDRTNQIYAMLFAVCELASSGLLQENGAGEQKVVSFLDDQRMSHLYEKFLLAYFRREFREAGLEATAEVIPWALDEGSGTRFLPLMKTDVTLRRGSRILVIDAKFYEDPMQEYFGAKTIHSGNLYQIYTYVKNLQKLVGNETEVSGMLLYARTDTSANPDAEFSIDGSRIMAKSLDLSCTFSKIQEQLDAIALNCLGVRKAKLSDPKRGKVSSSRIFPN